MKPEVITAERIDIRGISPSMPLQVLSDWQVEQMVVLESEAAKMPRESLIIVDSITAINRNCFFSENDTEYARPILQIRDIARKFGHTVILLHHSNAEGNARGTRAIHNSVDAVWGLSLIDQSDRLLRVQKTRMGLPPGRYRLAFDDETFKFAYRGEEFESEEDFEQAQTYAEKIRLWLHDTDQRERRFEPVEVAEHLGGSKPTTRRCLLELWMRGAIDRIRKAGSPYYLYFVKKKQKSDRAIAKAIGSQNAQEPSPEINPAIKRSGDRFEKNRTPPFLPKSPIARSPVHL
ncbi:MAG: AAA family ATPase [Leptolyngbyaceae cyanobacterium SM1_3_5]|nr:AAA family ATPase [Leptolyngbyaceae cyanobacterium SM1_3_5]